MSDFVRMRDLPELRALGLAGRTGETLGESVPSLSGVLVTGAAPDDFVVYVAFDVEGAASATDEDGVWIAPEFLELDPSHYTADELAARAEAGQRAREQAQEADVRTRNLDGPAERSPNDFLGRLLDRIWPD